MGVRPCGAPGTQHLQAARVPSPHTELRLPQSMAFSVPLSTKGRSSWSDNIMVRKPALPQAGRTVG